MTKIVLPFLLTLCLACTAAVISGKITFDCLISRPVSIDSKFIFSMQKELLLRIETLCHINV